MTELEEIGAQIKVCCISSLFHFFSHRVQDVNNAHFICWTTYSAELERLPWEYTVLPSADKAGAPYWWTLSRKPRECLPLFDQKHTPSTRLDTHPRLLPSQQQAPHEGFFYLA